MKTKLLLFIFILSVFFILSMSKNKQTLYCERCGLTFKNLNELLSQRCEKALEGPYLNRHKLYEGTEKEMYTCKYCGYQYKTIRLLTSLKCLKHPNGEYKGDHAPEL